MPLHADGIDDAMLADVNVMFDDIFRSPEIRPDMR
jgi:hypothetical protein